MDHIYAWYSNFTYLWPYICQVFATAGRVISINAQCWAFFSCLGEKGVHSVVCPIHPLKVNIFSYRYLIHPIIGDYCVCLIY
jgi:hypothetical protein